MLKSENLSLEQVRGPSEEQRGRSRAGEGKGEGTDPGEKPIWGGVGAAKRMALPLGAHQPIPHCADEPGSSLLERPPFLSVGVSLT